MPDFAISDRRAPVTISGPRNDLDVKLPGGSADANTARQAAIATAADRVQTALDRADVATKAGQVEAGRAEVAANRTAVDDARVQTGLDRVATQADRAQTELDRAAASSSASSAQAAQAGVAAALVNQAIRRPTLAALQAVTGQAEHTVGEVYDDPANNGSYRVLGGVWTRFSGATIPSLDARATVTEGNIRRAPKTSSAVIAWALRMAGRVVPLSVDTEGRTTAWALRIVPGLRRWRFAGIIPLIVHQGSPRPWTPLWAQQSDGTIDLIPSASLKRRLGSALDAPTALFAGGAVANAPGLQFLASSVEGWPERYGFRTDIPTPAVAVAQSAQRAVFGPSNGQSNDVMGGADDFPVGQRAVTTTPPNPHRGLMLEGGPVHSSLTDIDPATITDFRPCAETATGESKTSSQMRWMIAQDIAAGLAPPVHIGAAHGFAGRRLAEISKGTSPYTNGLMLTRKARELALAYGLPGIWVPAHPLDQGEADRTATTRAEWLALAQTYRADREADLRAITRQAEPIWMVVCQLGTAPGATITAQTALPQQDLMMQAPRVTIAMPAYFFQGSTYGMSGVHFRPAGHALRGEYVGRAIRIIRRRIEAAVAAGADPWALTIAEVRTCLRPDYANITRSGAVITIPLILPEGATAVVLDTTTLPAAPNFGWTKTAGSGGAITGVALVGNAIQITLASPGGATLRYAYDPEGTVTTDRSGAWGNFRDNCEDDSIAVPGLKLRNWLIICDMTVA